MLFSVNLCQFNFQIQLGPKRVEKNVFFFYHDSCLTIQFLPLPILCLLHSPKCVDLRVLPKMLSAWKCLPQPRDETWSILWMGGDNFMCFCWLLFKAAQTLNSCHADKNQLVQIKYYITICSQIILVWLKTGSVRILRWWHYFHSSYTFWQNKVNFT